MASGGVPKELARVHAEHAPEELELAAWIFTCVAERFQPFSHIQSSERKEVPDAYTCTAVQCKPEVSEFSTQNFTTAGCQWMYIISNLYWGN